MEFIVILGIIILIAIIVEFYNDRPKPIRKLVAYNTQTGAPIYLDQCRLLGYNPETGNPIFENPYKIVKYNSQTGAPIYAAFEISIEEYNSLKPTYTYKQETIKTKKTLTEEEKHRTSNSILMIVGALLVVVASIIFLASSWETTSGIIKTGVLVLIQVIFCLFGYLCNNKLKIEKVAKVFNYLALCFVPIILLSLSSFELIGDYLSINGKGAILYFSLTFVFSDILYKVIGWLKKDTVSKIMSYIAEVLAVLFITIHFNISFEAILFVLSIYNILLYIIIHGNYLDKKAYKISNNVLSYIILGFLALTMMYTENLIVYIAMVFYTIYYYTCYSKGSEKNTKVYNLVLFIITYVINLTIINKIDVSPYFVYILGIIPLILLTKVIKNEKVKSVLYIIESVVGLLFILDSLNFPNKTIYYLLTFVAGLILYLVMYVITKKSIYRAASYALFTSIFMDIFYICDIFEYAKYIPLVSVLLIYSFELLFDNLKDEWSRILIVTILMIESFLLVETYAVLIPLIMMMVYIKLEKLDEILLIIPMLTSLSLFVMNDNSITLVLSYILVSIYTIMSLFHKKFTFYSGVSLVAIVTAAFTFNYNNLIFFAILLLWSIVHLIRNYKDKNYAFRFVNIISLLGLYISALDYFDINFNSLYIIGFYVAVITMSIFVLNFIKNGFDTFIGCFGFAIISLISFFVIKEVNDALIIMSFLFIISIISFIKKWHHYLYESLIVMVVNIVYLTFEFWAQIPWYFYILVIGMGLIVFAMFDEKFKQKKAKKDMVPLINEVFSDNEGKEEKVESLNTEISNLESTEKITSEIEKVIENIPVNKEKVNEKNKDEKIIKKNKIGDKVENVPKKRGRRKKGEKTN